MEEKMIVLRQDILAALKELGVNIGQNLIVHSSIKKMGFVCGGPQVVIEALLDAVGEEGTIMMPSQSWKNLDPAYGVHPDEPEEWWDLIRENWPAYDKAITPTNTMGVIAEMFRKWPGAVRSDHPVRSFSAYGRNAEYLMKEHSLSDIFGETSPLAKLYQLDGYVLLLGVGHNKNTSLHLADARARYASKHMESNSCAMMVNGHREWVTYQTLYVDGEDFIEIGEAFEKEHHVKKAMIGNAPITLMRQRELVDFAVDWIEKNRK